MVTSKTYESVLWGHGSYRFSEDSKIVIHPTVILYEGIKFRPDIKLLMEENSFIGDHVVVLVPRLEVGKGSQINAGTVIAGKCPVLIGRDSVIGFNSTLITASDSPEALFMNDASPEKDRIIKLGPIQISANVFIGSGSIIMPNVRIAPSVVVRAQSYVDKDLREPAHIYDGNKPLRSRWKQ